MFRNSSGSPSRPSWSQCTHLYWGRVASCYPHSDGGSLIDCKLSYPHFDCRVLWLIASRLCILMVRFTDWLPADLLYLHFDGRVHWLIASWLIWILMGAHCLIASWLIRILMGITDWLQAVLSAFWCGVHWLIANCLIPILIGGFPDWLSAVSSALWWEGPLIDFKLSYLHSDGWVHWLIASSLIRILMRAHWLIASFFSAFW